MKYRTLGKTNLKVSVIGVGTWQFGGEWGRTYTQEEADAILDQAKDSGINLIDTAECYGDHTSERLIGAYLAKGGRREDWVVATKFGHKFTENFTRTQEWSPADVLQQLEDSLRALQTDYIDLYQFHSGVDEVFAQDALWTLLDKQVQAGKIRHLGTSIASNDNLHQTQASERVNSQVIQVVYNRLDRKAEERVLPESDRQGLGVLARVPLASGYLSGKYKPGDTFKDNDVRHRHDPAETKRKLEEVERIREQELPAGLDMATWALAWCLKHRAVSAVIPGCKDPAQVIANARAAEYVGDGHPQRWKE